MWWSSLLKAYKIGVIIGVGGLFQTSQNFYDVPGDFVESFMSSACNITRSELHHSCLNSSIIIVISNMELKCGDVETDFPYLYRLIPTNPPNIIIKAGGFEN